MRGPRSWTGVLVTGPVLALTAMLSGCGTTEAGAAAVVGDRRISVAELQDTTTQVQQFAGAEQQVDQRSVLFFLVAAPYVLEAAQRGRSGVSVDDARSLIGSKVAEPTEGTLEFFRANLAVQKIQGQADGQERLAGVVKQITDAAPQINPRYGRWDAKTVTIAEAEQNWIAASPSPSPSASPGTSPEPGPGTSPSASPTTP